MTLALLAYLTAGPALAALIAAAVRIADRRDRDH